MAMDTKHPHASGHEAHGGTGHEGSDVDVKGILGFGAGLAICTALVSWVLYGMFGLMREQFTPKPVTANPLVGVREPKPAEQMPKVFPEPRLQVDYFGDTAIRNAGWNEELHSYGWVDKGAGVVHIPIEQAMELTLQRGLPTRSANGEMPVAPPKAITKKAAVSAPGQEGHGQ